MRRKREKGYWKKQTEKFVTGAAAKTRAGIIRGHEHTSHVTVGKEDGVYVVRYSVAKWYLEDLAKAKLTL